jgi:hypothetical protein
MFLNFRSHFNGIQLVLDSLVTIAEIDQEDVIATQNFEATLSDHWDLAAGVNS